jgi:sodium-dependent phosphate cotransporter
MMGGAFKLFGKEWAEKLITVTSNPFLGLLIGVLATSLMQSSSSTTSIVVGMVAGGSLGIPQAIPLVMGANIGTTITNILVSLGHMGRRKEFELAFSGATVHDFFNLCSVTVLLPLEILFHPIERAATFISQMLIGLEGATFHSPLKAIVTPVAHAIRDLAATMFESKGVLAVVLLVLALALLLFALAQMVKIMRGALAKKMELLVDQYLFTSTARALFVGAALTAIVQSSSVTTSLVVPLLGVGIVKLEAVYPYMVGANIGTTVTAILASLVTGNASAVTVAICHLVFNVFAMAIFLPLRRVPITMAKLLGRATAKRRWIAPVFTLLAFFVIPGILVLLF